MEQELSRTLKKIQNSLKPGLWYPLDPLYLEQVHLCKCFIPLLCNFAETTEDTMGTQEDFTNAKEEAIDEEKAGQESEAGLDEWQDYIPTLLY